MVISTNLSVARLGLARMRLTFIKSRLKAITTPFVISYWAMPDTTNNKKSSKNLLLIKSSLLLLLVNYSNTYIMHSVSVLFSHQSGLENPRRKSRWFNKEDFGSKEKSEFGAFVLFFSQKCVVRIDIRVGILSESKVKFSTLNRTFVNKKISFPTFLMWLWCKYSRCTNDIRYVCILNIMKEKPYIFETLLNVWSDSYIQVRMYNNWSLQSIMSFS